MTYSRAPWITFEDSIKSGNGETIAQIYAVEGDRFKRYGKGESDINATLISAAPNMFEALSRFLHAMELKSYPELQGVTSDAYAAIEKATGVKPKPKPHPQSKRRQ